MGIKVSFSEKGSLSLQSEILIRMYILKRKLIRNALYAVFHTTNLKNFSI